MGSWWEIGYTANCVIYWSWGFNMIQWFYYEQLGFIQANMESWPTINRNMGWVDSYCTILNIHQSQLFGIHHDTGIAEGGIIQMWFRWILNFWCSSWKIKTWEIHDQNLGCVRCGNFSHRPKKKKCGAKCSTLNLADDQWSGGWSMLKRSKQWIFWCSLWKRKTSTADREMLFFPSPAGPKKRICSSSSSKHKDVANIFIPPLGLCVFSSLISRKFCVGVL